MIYIKKINGFLGLNHQIIRKSWDVTPVTDERRTEDGKWKIEQCSVRPETAISDTVDYYSQIAKLESWYWGIVIYNQWDRVDSIRNFCDVSLSEEVSCRYWSVRAPRCLRHIFWTKVGRLHLSDYFSTIISFGFWLPAVQLCNWVENLTHTL